MQNQTKSSTKPTFFVYQVRENGDESYWTRIGAAWSHNDGNGFSLQLNAVPLDGRLVMRSAAADENKA